MVKERKDEPEENKKTEKESDLKKFLNIYLYFVLYDIIIN